MKKIYEKPIVIFESFELAKSIASGCELILVGSTEGSCPVEVPELNFGEVSFTYIAAGSTCYTEAPGGNDKICYHAPTENYNVSTS